MTRPRRTSLRYLRVLAWGLLAVAPALAQLDPKLQASKTDFLDLYQQSTTDKAKPEILSIFDFSRSMSGLMTHPLFRNDDALARDDESRTAAFGLSPVTTTTQYGFLATANNACTSHSYYSWITVKADRTATWSASANNISQCASDGQCFAFSIGCSSAATQSCAAGAYFVPESGFVATLTHPYPNMFLSSNATLNGNTATSTFSITDATKAKPAPTLVFSPTQPAGGYTPGTVVTATAYLLHPPVEGEGSTPKTLNWLQVWYLKAAATGPGDTATGYQNGAWLTGAMTTEDPAIGFYKSVCTFTIPGAQSLPKTNDPVCFKDIYVQSVTGSTTNTAGPFKSGDVLTFATYLVIPGTTTSITFGIGSTSGLSCSGSLTPKPKDTPSAVNSASTPWTATWKIPEPCPPAARSARFTLDPRVGSEAIPGITYLTNPWYDSAVLIKPDGTQVTAADADKAKTSGSGLEYASLGKDNIINWVRAASHLRLTATVIGVLRTIDVPIPWKIIDPTSTTNPLGSVTAQDRQIKAGVTYGSGLQIELDQCYRHNQGSGSMFVAGAYVAAYPTSIYDGVTLYGVTYRPAYLSWLFTAKYQSSDATKPNYTTESSLVGKFVVFDAANKSIVGGQGNVSWGQGFGPTGEWGNIRVPQYAADGTYTGAIWDDASKYRIPALTRLQAVKQAAIQTWTKHQADAYWAFRFLDPGNEATSGTATTINNLSNGGGDLAYSTTWVSNASRIVAGNYSCWWVLNNTAAQGITSSSGNSVNGMKYISHMFASGGTPTTYALARSLAQFTDANNVFNTYEGTDVSQCGSSFMLLITDGADDNAKGSINTNTASPYFTGTGADMALDAGGGNRAIIANKTSIDRTGTYWNTFTMAGIGAHLADSSLGTVNVDYLAAKDPASNSTYAAPSTFLPLAFKKRNNITLNQDRRVMTLTMGVGLGGKYTDANSAKRNLFLAAVAGDPGITSGPLSGFHSFDPTTDWLVDPRDPASYPAVGKRADGAVFFFDATSTDKLITGMDYLFRIATSTTTTSQATTSPNLPFVGAAMGNQIYLGRFMPPVAGGVLWAGDLLMFSTKEVSGSISILDKTGTATTTLDATTAQWSAAAALAAGPVGTDRKLYTRVPGGAALKRFTATGTNFTDATTGLKNYVATGLAITDTATKQLVIHHAAGGDITNLDASSVPKTNRPSIMGDIINSAPAAIEYKWSEVSGSLSSYSTLSAFGGTRFRLVLVGTNQGWLHAFGEVTKTDAAGLVTGAVQELWSFLPTDFLANLNYLKDNGNAHRFMVDGTPVIYHLDLPPSGGGRGNGVVDSAERAVAIFGLRKGGRSYYALDIHDPFNPTLKWSLVPDEAASLTADRIATGGPTLVAAKSLLAKAGFSTSTPAFGRIQDSSLVLRDAVFLGGGASNAEVDAQFSSTKLGRFVLALDAYSGQLLAAADLTAASAGGATVGPVASLVPFEFITNSGMAQRAYFTDYTGGLWAWGSREIPGTAPYTNFRKDTSKLGSWALRKVYQDDNVGNGARYTTLPAPFRVASYPVRAAAGSAIPAAVGIALVSGDRNNPLDRSYAAGTNPAPSNHRLTVVFDRQDSRAWGFDTAGGPDTGIGTTNLRNFTANEVTSTPGTLCTDSLFKLITPGCDDYYLAPKTGTPSFGYYVAFPSAASGTGFVAKGINPPLVVAGSLFYSYFTPVTSNACTGGSGTTSSWLITDVMNPIVTDTRSGLSITSGLKNTWSGVASDFLALGTRSVLQGGMKEVSAADASKGIAAVTAVSLTTSATSVTERYPKARVWRTVH
ncbi:MAG: PilC/PilY family type IV pilus protein [Acidobacteria bacterium]|nr:PilC/PilY family type IV pilus protein [Acidobacteriota bacterium]